jgi:DNA adenine methylase
VTLNTKSAGCFITPLRYPGGKGRLGPWLGQVIEANGLKGGWYIEPYAGGAGAALYLLKQGFVDQIVINDADPVIHAFWVAVTEHTDAFIDKLESTPVTVDKRLELLQIIAAPKGKSVLDIGFAAFFLNRTNRSGILAGGVIGGKLQDGLYKLNARYNKNDLISRIQVIGSLRNRINVLGVDALDLLADYSPGFPEKTLISRSSVLRERQSTLS